MNELNEIPDPDATQKIPLEQAFDYETDEIPEILAAYATYTRGHDDDA